MHNQSGGANTSDEFIISESKPNTSSKYTAVNTSIEDNTIESDDEENDEYISSLNNLFNSKLNRSQRKTNMVNPNRLS